MYTPALCCHRIAARQSVVIIAYKDLKEKCFAEESSTFKIARRDMHVLITIDSAVLNNICLFDSVAYSAILNQFVISIYKNGVLCS